MRINNIKDLREARGMSLQDVSNELKLHGYEMSRSAISRIETGSRRLTMDWAEAFAKAFRCTMSDVIGGDAAGFDLAELRKTIEEQGLSKSSLATALGKRPQAVTYMLNGERRIRPEEVVIIREWLATAPKSRPGRPPMNPAPSSTVRIPVYSLVKESDGFHRERVAAKFLDSTNPLDGVRGAFAEIFPMTVEMAPRFEPGDILAIDPTKTPRPGDYVRVELNTGVIVYRKLESFSAAGFKISTADGTESTIKESDFNAMQPVVATFAG